MDSKRYNEQWPQFTLDCNGGPQLETGELKCSCRCEHYRCMPKVGWRCTKFDGVWGTVGSVGTGPAAECWSKDPLGFVNHRERAALQDVAVNGLYASETAKGIAFRAMARAMINNAAAKVATEGGE